MRMIKELQLYIRLVNLAKSWASFLDNRNYTVLCIVLCTLGRLTKSDLWYPSQSSWWYLNSLGIVAVQLPSANCGQSQPLKLNNIIYWAFWTILNLIMMYISLQMSFNNEITVKALNVSSIHNVIHQHLNFLSIIAISSKISINYH